MVVASLTDCGIIFCCQQPHLELTDSEIGIEQFRVFRCYCSSLVPTDDGLADSLLLYSTFLVFASVTTIFFLFFCSCFNCVPLQHVHFCVCMIIHACRCVYVRLSNAYALLGNINVCMNIYIQIYACTFICVQMNICMCYEVLIFMFFGAQIKYILKMQNEKKQLKKHAS